MPTRRFAVTVLMAHANNGKCKACLKESCEIWSNAIISVKVLLNQTLQASSSNGSPSSVGGSIRKRFWPWPWSPPKIKQMRLSGSPTGPLPTRVKQPQYLSNVRRLALSMVCACSRIPNTHPSTAEALSRTVASACCGPECGLKSRHADAFGSNRTLHRNHRKQRLSS